MFKVPKYLEDFLRRTCLDTVEFMRVPVKTMRIVARQITDPKVKEGYEQAIDYLESFIETGESVLDKVVNQKITKLQELMNKEVTDCNIDPNMKGRN